MTLEIKDQQLFDKIAIDYTKKDIYPVSRFARKFQLFSLFNLINKDHFEHILDIGCGPGYNADYLEGKYNQYTGVDYSEKFIEIAGTLHAKGNFITGNIKNLDQVCTDNYDIILGCGVLHHIDNLDEALSSIRKICNNSTIVAFIEPYNGNPVVQLLRFIRKHIDKSYSEDQIFFSRKELLMVFRKNGFKINTIQYQGYFSTPFAQIILKPAQLFYPICWLTVKLDKFIQNKINNPFSWNIIFTASVNNEQKESI
jgi:SAM-dependent methyltransferase